MRYSGKCGVIVVSKNTFTVDGNIVFINRDGWNSLARATYREDYYDELSNYTWSVIKGYPRNGRLGGLHRYMVAKWYGQEVLDDLTDKGYVVDHLDNDHMNCEISNLEFLKHNRNVAKGMYLDKERKQMNDRIALSLFKDFKEGLYQITIGFNDPYILKDESGNEYYVSAIKLLYNCDYSLVILDAESILTQYDKSGSFSLESLRYCDKHIIKSPNIELSGEEENKLFVERDGEIYLVLGNGKATLRSIYYDEGWKVPIE